MRPDRRSQILQALADGAHHSGEQLAAALGLTRTAIWQHVNALKALGIGIGASRGHGYRLDQPLELLDRQRILAGIEPALCAGLTALDVYFETDSTNQRLLEAGAARDVHRHACVAEVQSAGRGRRGRQWVAPLGAGVCLSIAWRFNLAVMLSGLSLAVAVAVRRALLRMGADAIAFKWPNDLVWHHRKLAGILAEVRGETGGPCTVVIGIGINVAMPPEAAEMIEQPYTDLQSAMKCDVSRNALTAAVLSELLILLPQYETGGLLPFLEEWRQADAIRGERIELSLPNRRVQGRAVDIDDNGALLVDVDGTVSRYISGEVSLRVSP